jgi:tetratricopeptide (TPR) repeat protein
MVREEENVAHRFVADLRELRQRAGRPSLSTLERMSGHQLRRATVSDVLNNNRVNLPAWAFVAAFVAACRAAADESGLDVAELGTVADWKRHWDSASSGVIGARFPGQGHPSMTGPDAPETPAEPAEPAGPTADFAGPGQPAGEVTTGPDRVPAVWGMVPPQLPDFAGRKARLADVRDALAGDGRRGMVTIQGMLGIGKTQLAIEYAYRFAHEYDLVWWIPCRDAEAAHAAMAGLAARLGVEVPGDRRYDGIFNVLRRGALYRRWLLVFDHANEPDEIGNLIPPIGGHILITSRNSRWEATGDMLELDVFERAESIDFLQRRMRKLDVTAAHRLADAVGDLPILLEHAAESQTAIDQYIAQLEGDPLSLLDGQPSDYEATIKGEWQAILSQLRAGGRDCLDLLACLCFFDNGPIPQESLERGRYLGDVSINGVLRKPMQPSLAVMILQRAGVLRMRAEDKTLVVHPATRYIVRAMINQEGVDRADRARHDVHLLLAAADPLDPEDPANWRGYEALHGHVAQSQAEACDDESVRRLVVNLVRYLTSTGDPRAALSLADDALGRWTADLPDASHAAADGCLQMRHAKAVALLACGQAEAAFQLQQETLAAMRSTSREWTADIVLLNRITGARDRMTGNFRDAQVADQESAHAHVRQFGRDHPHVLPALISVVTDLVLNGDYGDATRTAERVYGDCLALYNDAGYPTVLVQRNLVGRCHWLTGRYDEAVRILAQVHDGYGMAARSGSIDGNHPWRLAHEVDYAVARRDKGLADTGIRALADDMQKVRRRCWRKLGPDHPQTIAATVVLATCLRHVAGWEQEAARLLEEAQRRYRSALPDHPYGDACTGFLTTIRYWTTAGSPQRAAAEAVPVLGEVIERLRGSVGADHPLTLTAVSSLANSLARAGDLDAARNHEQEALAGFQTRLGAGHPHALAVEANAATIQSRMGYEPASQELRARWVAALGPDHRDLAAFTQGQLIDIDFTPLPL